MKDLKLKKLLKQNKGRTFFHKNCSEIFIDNSLKANEIKAKTNKLDLIKLKNFNTAKETIYKMKRQLMEWEKIFANDMSKWG